MRFRVRQLPSDQDGQAVETFEERATRLLKKWQHILRLDDWDVYLKFGRFHEVHNESLAHCRYKQSISSAEIMLLVPDDQRPESWPGNNNTELTIIHELLHVKLCMLETADSLTVRLEQVVESLARMLLSLAGEEPIQ